MSVQLHDLGDYRPLGQMGNLDRYLLTAGGSDGSEYASTYAAALGMRMVDPQEIERLVLSQREELQKQQGVASYVGSLAAQLQQAAGRTTGVASSERLAHTALTELFREQYKVAVHELTRGRPNVLRVFGRVFPLGMSEGLGLDYQIYEGRTVKTFWQLHLNGIYGFVNMHCIPIDALPTPLKGSGNIAFIPGVEAALTADVQMLVEAKQRG